MPLTIELPEEALARLRSEADRRGINIDELVAELAAQLPSAQSGCGRRRLSFVGIGRSTSGRHAVDADELLAEGFGRD